MTQMESPGALAGASTGTVCIHIWRDERRDDGFFFRCADWPAVGRLIGRIASEAEGRA